MPKVSVIIPVYGVEKYIERCAISLFEQTLAEMEFIFVDDCTLDCSIEILKDVLEQYPHRKKQTRIIKMSMNSGQAAVRKHGIQFATGEYIIYCDSDDWVDVTMYQKLYEKAIKEKSDIVVCGYKEINDSIVLKKSIHLFNTKDEYISNMLSVKESWAVWDKLCKRELYQDFIYPQYPMGEDIVFTFQLVLKAKKISNIKECLYNYYYNAKSITKDSSEEKRYKNWKQSVLNFKEVVLLLEKYKMQDKFEDEINYFKYKQKKLAGNLAYNRKYANEWLYLFSSINKKIYSMKNITLIEKFKYLIIVCIAYLKAQK